MVTAFSYNQIKEWIEYSFEKHNVNSKLIGVIFAQPTTFIKSEVADSIEYFHYRSENNIAVFWAGYEQAEYDHPKVWDIDNVPWRFNVKKFNALRKEFESETRWEYSGETDLLLFKANMNSSKHIEFDYSDAIIVNLEKAKSENAISSVRGLFEIIFRLSEGLQKDNLSLELSAKLIKDTGKKAVFPLLVSFLPERFHKDVNKVYTFCTENISKNFP